MKLAMCKGWGILNVAAWCEEAQAKGFAEAVLRVTKAAASVLLAVLLVLGTAGSHVAFALGAQGDTPQDARDDEGSCAAACDSNDFDLADSVPAPDLGADGADGSDDADASDGAAVSDGADAPDVPDGAATSDAPDDPDSSDVPDSPSPIPELLITTDEALPAALLGSVYDQALEVRGIVSEETVSWSIDDATAGADDPVHSELIPASDDVLWSGGGLPQGLYLSEKTGRITGTPVADGLTSYPTTATFAVKVQTSTGRVALKRFTLVVAKVAVGPGEGDGTKPGGEGGEGDGGDQGSDDPDPDPDPDDPGTDTPSIMLTMPPVVGLSQRDALSLFLDAGFSRSNIVVEVQESETVAKGFVLSCSPAAGAQVLPGTTVTVTISLGPAGQQDQNPELLSLDLYAFSTNEYGGFVSRLGENGRVDNGLGWEVPGGIKTKGGQIRLCAYGVFSDGTAYYQTQSNCPDFKLAWTSSNPGVATVSSRGVVTAVSNGEAVITAASADGPVCSMRVVVFGQSGAYPVYLEIVDELGDAYGDSRVTFSDIGTSVAQFYVRIWDSEGASLSNAPHAFDYAPAHGIFDTLMWSCSNTEKGYIDKNTGTFAPRGFADLKVYATVSGGDPLVNDGEVRGYVWIVIDSGNYDQYLPASSLTVRITYELYRDEVAKEVEIPVSTLRSIQTVESTYTLTSENGEYVTASARGIYLTTLLDYLEVGTDDIYGFYFSALDGVNPGLVSADFLFRPRYYLPNIEFGGNTSGAQLVFPMLAYESDWRDSGKGASNADADYSALDGGTCLRLLFGSVGASDMSMSKSLRYTNVMEIVLKGAPPAKPGTGGDDGTGDKPGSTPGGPSGNAPTEGGGTKPEGPGEGGGGADPDTSNNPDPDNPSDQENGGSREDDPQEQDATDDGNEATQPEAELEADPQLAEAAGEAGAMAELSSDQAGDGGQGAWRVYQMMSNIDTDLALSDYENPLIPLFVIGLVGTCVAGGCYSALRFRRKLIGYAPL